MPLEPQRPASHAAYNTSSLACGRLLAAQRYTVSPLALPLALSPIALSMALSPIAARRALSVASPSVAPSSVVRLSIVRLSIAMSLLAMPPIALLPPIAPRRALSVGSPSVAPSSVAPSSVVQLSIAMSPLAMPPLALLPLALYCRSRCRRSNVTHSFQREVTHSLHRRSLARCFLAEHSRAAQTRAHDTHHAEFLSAVVQVVTRCFVSCIV